MRLLMIADTAQTGFGRVGREFGRRFLDAGLDLRIIAVNWRGPAGEVEGLLAKGQTLAAASDLLREMEGDPLTERMFSPLYGAPGDPLGKHVTKLAAEGALPAWPGWRADAILAIADPRLMMDRLRTGNGIFESLPSWDYVPIEGTNLPPLWRLIWEHVQPVAMTDFGGQQLADLLGRPVPVIPHGISDAFHPLTPSTPGHYRDEVVASKDAAKRVFGLTGKTVLLRTDRFVLRKDYPALFRSLGPVLAAHPDAVLVIHCASSDEGGMLPELISAVPGAFLGPSGWSHPQIRPTAAHDTFRGLSDAELAVLYNAADIYVSPTMGEGFGLTLVEAAACGVPVVTTDTAAGPEVVGPGGLYARPRAFFTNTYAHDWALVDQDDFAAKVTHLIEHPAQRRALGEAGARHVRRYSWDRAASDFLDLFRQGEAALAA